MTRKEVAQILKVESSLSQCSAIRSPKQLRGVAKECAAILQSMLMDRLQSPIARKRPLRVS